MVWLLLTALIQAQSENEQLEQKDTEKYDLVRKRTHTSLKQLRKASAEKAAVTVKRCVALHARSPGFDPQHSGGGSRRITSSKSSSAV